MRTFSLLSDNKKTLTNCIVIENINSLFETISELKSYNTTVAKYNHDTNKMQVFGYYSLTTAKHINSFLKFYGFDKCTKTQLKNYNSL